MGVIRGDGETTSTLSMLATGKRVAFEHLAEHDIRVDEDWRGTSQRYSEDGLQWARQARRAQT